MDLEQPGEFCCTEMFKKTDGGKCRVEGRAIGLGGGRLFFGGECTRSKIYSGQPSGRGDERKVYLQRDSKHHVHHVLNALRSCIRVFPM